MNSVLELFSIGIGPSSSHTVGPMLAANDFVVALVDKDLLASTTQIQVDLYGSLALTGKGHKTDTAVLLGLQAFTPEDVEVDNIEKNIALIHEQKTLKLANKQLINFQPDNHIAFHKNKFLTQHANGMTITASSAENTVLWSETYFSIGGGFIVKEGAEATTEEAAVNVPYPFKSAKELLHLCRVNHLTIPQLVLKNETAWRSAEETRTAILTIAQVMQQSITRGSQQTGVLPGGLNVRRRAASLFKKLNAEYEDKKERNKMQWLNLYAIAVNEENANGGRIVTAPTNGAAGIIPAVLQYYKEFIPAATEQGVIDFLCTAAAIGMLYKQGASLSAAEVGCQGEVGVACSMAAGALTSVLGGTLEQIENAAEMGMEHNLGLTCDPINGLVQIPCIERNAMGAVQAVNCTELALLEDGEHHVSLDKVIATMLRTGKDMQSIYKETSLGGLAVNIPEC